MTTLKYTLRLGALALAISSPHAPCFANGGLPPDTDSPITRSAGDGKQDRFIVKYRTGTQLASDPTARAASLSAVGTSVFVSLAPLRPTAVGAWVVQSDRRLVAAEVDALLLAFAADPAIEFAEIDRRMQVLMVPDDPEYDQQWGYTDEDAGIRAEEAWDISTGAGAVVAVLDTGITPHSDLAANVLPGHDFISDAFVANDGNGRDGDPGDPGDGSEANECGLGVPGYSSSWHGTHVAGTVAALTDNHRGVAGTAFDARIVPVRVLGKCGGYESDVADAIVWASGGIVQGVPANAHTAEAINLSLGIFGACGSNMQASIDEAVANGTTLAVAAGNGGADVVSYSPANCNKVIAVAALTRNGARASYSNYGSRIDIAAPGSSILSTINDGAMAPGGEAYGRYSGTSMAAPHVAGVIALAQSASETPRTPAQMEALIKSSARAFPVPPQDSIGAGVLDAHSVLKNVGSDRLFNGVPITGLKALAGQSRTYRLEVPAAASNLRFSIRATGGDADLYIRRATAPTDVAYDCRPYLPHSNEDCAFGSPAPGTWFARVKAYTAFAGLELRGTYALTYANAALYLIFDHAVSESPIAVTARAGKAPTDAAISVNIVHSYRGDLKVDLVAPDGSIYNLHNRTGGSANDLVETFYRDLSTEQVPGTWKLRVFDAASGDLGFIDDWTLTL